MERLSLSNKNAIRIETNDEGEYITINLADADFPRRFLALYEGMKQRIADLDEKRKELEGAEVVEQLKYFSNVHKGMMEDIDSLFGPETCRKVFGDIIPDTMLVSEFFEAVIPIMEKYSKQRNAEYGKYSPKRKGGRR